MVLREEEARVQIDSSAQDMVSRLLDDPDGIETPPPFDPRVGDSPDTQWVMLRYVKPLASQIEEGKRQQLEGDLEEASGTAYGGAGGAVAADVHGLGLTEAASSGLSGTDPTVLDDAPAYEDAAEATDEIETEEAGRTRFGLGGTWSRFMHDETGDLYWYDATTGEAKWQAYMEEVTR